MATHLLEASVSRAIEHLCEFGDTDVFPHLCELPFLVECKDDVVAELSKLDLDTHEPMQAIETLAPKSKYGFRVVHQQQLLDVVLFTAAVIEVAEDLQKNRTPKGGYGSFSYHFNPKGKSSLFSKKGTYRDWLKKQQLFHKKQKFAEVIFADIADFYQRIYLHRIENCLDVGTGKKGPAKFITKNIKAIRSRQSYGIPIGGSASRIIAEAVLADSDAALLSEKYKFSRFVDDYRIFMKKPGKAYQALSFLAEQLYLSDGLTLNGQKIKVVSGDDYSKYLEEELPEKAEKAQAQAFETLSGLIYFDEEPDPDAIDALGKLNLLGMLEDAINEGDWDFGEIKALFRAIRLVKADDAEKFLRDNFQKLLPFSKEIVLFFDVVKPKDSKKLSSVVMAALNSQTAANVPTIAAWLLEFYTRSILKIDSVALKKLPLDGPLCDRQILLIRGLNKEVNYFRKNKTKFDGLGAYEKSAFILGATCLPKDEYSNWLGAIKPKQKQPLEKLYCEWAKKKCGLLADTIATIKKNAVVDEN